ncbi:hypothetical protein L6164_010571 [Bauhinia variegata]|uniref:Uncharacterized protein n=1 Tax=Bauhinia variegata TaxID=167791 RepID=A0ACB9PTZ3_BAUVA|nr:hypothetical protein L6164_010571 [Bauhinia variegata]
MATAWYCGRSPLLLPALSQSRLKQRTPGVHSCSTAPNYNKKDPATYDRETPQILKLAVSGVTELLRLFSPSDQERDIAKQAEELPVSSVDDVLMIIKSDYENAYFVTGNFTSAIYAEDCIFEDPTIKFRGKQLYERNLKLLVPFFECASIRLRRIEKDINSDSNFVLATWKLRTKLKLPWRPLISIDGSTIYELDREFKVGIRTTLLLDMLRVGMFPR